MLRVRILIGLGGAAAAVAAIVLVAGGDDQPTAPANPPARRIESRVILSGNVPRARPADFKAPIAQYRAHVRSELGAMLGDVRDLRAATVRGDVAAARRAWLAADRRYESIGAAYGAFGERAAAINGRPDGLQEGVRSRDFTGLHRVEYALWKLRSARAAAPYAAHLERDVARLRSSIATIEIDPFEYALRAHEVLEDALHLQLSGHASPWSGAALVALDGNVRGTEVVVASLRALVKRRNPGVLRRADRSVALLKDALRDVRRGDGSYPRWDALGQRDRELIGGRTAAAAEQLAFVPDLVDSRPARPVQRAFGTGGRQ